MQGNGGDSSGGDGLKGKNGDGGNHEIQRDRSDEEGIRDDILEALKEMEAKQPDVVMFIMTTNEGWTKGLLWTKEKADASKLLEAVQDVAEAYEKQGVETVH